MRGEGMVEVTNPSAAFLAERGEGTTGSAVLVTMEGTRPLLVEVQALASRSSLAVPRRAANGIETNRLLLVSAVLARRMGLPLHDQDSTSTSSAACGSTSRPPTWRWRWRSCRASATARSTRRRSWLGEVGLSGELRSVGQLELRLREAAKLGFERAVVPRSSTAANVRIPGLQVVQAATLREAANLALID